MFRNIKAHKKRIYAALILYWLILLLATSLPSNSLPDVGGGDKLKHFSAYLILTSLVTLALMAQEKSILNRNAYLFAVMISGIYGLADEIHQMFIPGRSCEFLDWVADFTGAITGALLVFILYQLDKKKTEKG